MLGQVLLRAILAILVINERGAAIPRPSRDFAHWVVRVHGNTFRPQRGALGACTCGVDPHLCCPVTTEAETEHQLLRPHDLLGIRARTWVAPLARSEGVVCSDPFVPLVWPRLISCQVHRHLCHGDPEHLNIGRRPLRSHDKRLFRHLLARQERQAVRRAPYHVRVVSDALVVPREVELGVHVLRAAGLAKLCFVKLALVEQPDVKRTARGNLVGVLQDVQLTTIRPCSFGRVRPECGPYAAAPGHLVESGRHKEVGPLDLCLDLGRRALEMIDLRSCAKNGMSVVCDGDLLLRRLLHGEVLDGSRILVVQQIIEVVEEGAPLRSPYLLVRVPGMFRAREAPA
mmetsp:Transcript_40802/g.94576  ORF Transcript_40802/g.94576 Transcript_40802/m.94576 type:complete len:343 (+) Transcript_40802:329-1357(+)